MLQAPPPTGLVMGNTLSLIGAMISLVDDPVIQVDKERTFKSLAVRIDSLIEANKFLNSRVKVNFKENELLKKADNGFIAILKGIRDLAKASPKARPKQLE